MSHVDEGALHAYLDGALDEYPAGEAQKIREHLDVCHECAGRLEAERALRHDAHAMLGLASPTIELPSLEELRAYVQRTRPAPSRMTVRVTRLSWAASVLLALGVGWTLRGGRMEPAALSNGTMPSAEAELGAVRGDVAQEPVASALADARSNTAEPEAEATVGAISDEQFGVRSDLPAASVAKVGAERAEVSAEPDVAAREAGDLVAAAPVTAAPDAAAPGMDAAEVAESLSDATAALPSDVVASAAGLPGAPSEPSALEAARRLSGADSGGVGGLGADRAMEVRDADADLASVDTPSVTEEEARPERRRAEAATAFTAQLDRSGRGGVRVVPEDDDRFDDEPPQTVPGLEVMAVDNLGDGLDFIGTVATQRLEGDAMVRVYVLEPDVGLEVLPPLDPAFNEVRVAAETGWVIVRGPRSEDDLEMLLMRLFPG